MEDNSYDGGAMRGRLVTIVVAAVVALAAGIGIGAAIWSGGDHDSGTASASTDHASDGMMTTESLDEQSFLEQMVPHHQSAIEMATMALDKAQRPEVRRLAQQIITAQEAEIAEMRDWHETWFGSELVAAEGDAHHDTDMTELEEAAGDGFDRAFLRMMIPHHASAIVMADAVMMDSPRTEIRELADEIVAAQAKEIGQMQEWREQWFPPLG